METKLFLIKYQLTLIDNVHQYMTTSTYIAAKNEAIAITKLILWLETQKRNYTDINILDITRGYNIIV